MQIYVTTPTGTTVTVEVEGSDTIENVKQKVQDKTGIDVADQIIEYEGQELANNRTLADYNIRSESTLQMRVAAATETTVVAADPIPPTGGSVGAAGVGLALLLVGAALVRMVRRPLAR